MQAYTALMKEYKQLLPVAEKYREYKKALADKDDYALLADSADEPELREEARAEYAAAESRCEKCREELKIMLLPKDPNDDKDVIIEIRAGAGGVVAVLRERAGATLRVLDIGIYGRGIAPVGDDRLPVQSVIALGEQVGFFIISIFCNGEAARVQGGGAAEIVHPLLDQVLAFMRGDLIFVFNFSPTQSFTDYGFLVPTGSYEVVLNTDATQFGGHGFADDSVVHMTNFDPLYVKDRKEWLKLYIPARSAVVLKKN